MVRRGCFTDSVSEEFLLSVDDKSEPPNMVSRICSNLEGGSSTLNGETETDDHPLVFEDSDSENFEEGFNQREPSHLEGLPLTVWRKRIELRIAQIDKTVRGWCFDLDTRFEKYYVSLFERDKALTKQLVDVQCLLSVAKEEIGRLAEQIKMLELQIAEKLQPSETKLPSPENFVSVNLNSGHVTNLQTSSVSSEKSSSDFAAQPRKFRQTRKFWRPAKNSWNDFQFLSPSWFQDWWGWDRHLNPWNSWGWYPPYQWWW
jgi:hypothetical protein